MIAQYTLDKREARNEPETIYFLAQQLELCQVTWRFGPDNQSVLVSNETPETILLIKKLFDDLLWEPTTLTIHTETRNIHMR